MQFKQPVANHITKITQSLLGVKKKKGKKGGGGQSTTSTTAKRDSCERGQCDNSADRREARPAGSRDPGRPPSYLHSAQGAVCREGIIWQSDKQTDRQTDKQSVGFWQRSHCQSHCHSVPLSSPTATGQYLSRQSPSLPNIEQHALAVSFFFLSHKWFLDTLSLFSNSSSQAAVLAGLGRSFQSLSPLFCRFFF